MPLSVTKTIAGWGNYPQAPCHVFRPHKRAEVARILSDGNHATCIARGLGRSYGDASLNREQEVILLTQLDRFLEFDHRTGVLECESGVSLGAIIEVFLPRGFFPLVTPGTQFVTVGGAIDGNECATVSDSITVWVEEPIVPRAPATHGSR